MTYTIFASPAGQRAMRKLPEAVRTYLKEEVRRLETQPMAGEPLKGEMRFLRSLHTIYNGTSYRLVYEVIERDHEIHVHFAGPRENFYKRLQKMKLKPTV